MIDIYLRDINANQSFQLACLNNASEVADMLDHVRETGVYVSETGERTNAVSMQYVVSENDAFVEFIVGDDE